jgi:uncharacterized delta-60 repeat protein
MRALATIQLGVLLFLLGSTGAVATPGSFNPDFGAATTVFTPFSPPYDSFISAIAVQPDGRIVVAGTRYISTTGAIALARYNRDGSLDASFGSGGKVTTSMQGSGGATAIAVLPDGKLLVAGQDSICRIARYTAAGALDTSFGVGGIVTTGLCSSVGGMAVDSSGRIVLAGRSMWDFVVARLTATGATDTSFNGGLGVVVAGTGSGSITYSATSVAITPGGQIVAAGHSFVAGLGLYAAALRIVRLNDNGSFDNTFGGTGVISRNVSVPAAPPNGPQDYAFGVAVQPGGEIVVAGSASPTTGPGHGLVARFTSAGALDTTFNGTGFAITPIGSNSSANAVALQPNGKIVTAGRANISTKDNIAVVRYLSTGALDSSFGTGGIVTLAFAGGAGAQSVALEPGGAIFVGGGANPFLTGMLFAVAGLEGDDTSPPDTSFTSAPASVITGPDVAYSFAAIDLGGSGMAGFDCRLDGASFTPCTSPTTLTGLTLGTHTFRVRGRDKAGNVEQAPAAHTIEVTPLASAPRLANISTRGQVQTGFDVMIGGFVLGSQATSKTVMIRAIGPSLAKYGVAGAIANPKLQIVRQSDQVVIAENDDWVASADAAAIDSSGVAPSDMLEAAIRITLAPGSYTAIVSGINGASGVGLVEVYELDHPDVPLVNISTRGKVMTGFDVMIGGFIIQGTGSQTVIIRAIGPSLANYGVAGALADPTLQLVRLSDGATIAFNNDWGTAANAAQIQSSGFAPSNPYESAILITLDPGAYTAIVSGLNGGIGVGLIEVYKVGN